MRGTKNCLLKGFSAILIGVFLLSGCGQKEKALLGSAFFGDYAVSGEGVIYTQAQDAERFSADTALLPVETDYCAIYGDKLYYADTNIGQETGEVKGGRCTIFSCELDGKESKKVLEMPDASYLQAFIQEGMLYCGWETSEGEARGAVVELSSGKTTEITSGKAVRAVDASGYYYESGNKIFYCAYKDSEGKLFCEPQGEVLALYFNGGNLCVLSENGSTASLFVYRADGTFIRDYGKLENVEGFQGMPVCVVKSEGAALYYELAGEIDSKGNNVKLVRLDLETEAAEIIGEWYMP